MPCTPDRFSLSRQAFTGGLTASLGTLLLERPALAASAIDEKGFVSIGGIDQWIAIQVTTGVGRRR